MPDPKFGPALSYRELRNTPGIVAERLAAGLPMPLVIEGEIRGVLLPATAGDAVEIAEMWARRQLWLALRAMQTAVVESGVKPLTMDAIDDEIAAARAERLRLETPAGALVQGPAGEDPPRRAGSVPRSARGAA